MTSLSLVLPFATRVHALNGVIVGLGSDGESRATVKLDGRVDEFGQVKVEGALSAFRPKAFTDLSVIFRTVKAKPGEDPGPVAFDQAKTQRALEALLTERRGTQAVEEFETTYEKSTGRRPSASTPCWRSSAAPARTAPSTRRCSGGWSRSPRSATPR